VSGKTVTVFSLFSNHITKGRAQRWECWAAETDMEPSECLHTSGDPCRSCGSPYIRLFPYPGSLPSPVWVRWLNSMSHLHTLKCHILHVVWASRLKPNSSNSIRSRSQRQLALRILPGSLRAILASGNPKAPPTAHSYT